VLRGAAGLRYLSLEYELHHGERSRLQWRMRRASLQR
jgi:hypothetical protein